MKKLLLTMSAVAFITVNAQQTDPETFNQVVKDRKPDLGKGISKDDPQDHLQVAEENGALLFGREIKIQKGSVLQVNAPYQYDFISVEPIESGFGFKNLGAAAQIAGLAGSTGALVGGMTKNWKTVMKAAQISQAASQVQNIAWTADEIGKLNASKKAKKIVAKYFVVTGWERDREDNIYYLLGKIENKNYRVNLPASYLLNEVKYNTK